MKRCDFCHRVYVQWLRCRDGTRRLFDATPVEFDDLAGRVGWVPGRVTHRGRDQVVMAPITQVSSAKADAARRVMVRHDCPEFSALYDRAMGSASG